MKIFILLLFTYSLQAENKNWSIALSFQDPAPGALGFKIGYFPSNFTRISLGSSVYTNDPSLLMSGISNHLITGSAYILTAGLIDYSEIYDYVAGTQSEVHRKAFSYAMGLEIFLPTSFTPVIGINAGRFRSKNHPFELKDKGSFVSYQTSLAWFSSEGFHLLGGFSHSNNLPPPLRNIWHFQLGVVF